MTPLEGTQPTSTCAVTRRFVDPARPFADAAAEALLQLAAAGEVADLRGWLVVVPGARAGRLVLRSLVTHASRAGRALEAPTITTVGRMVERALLPANPADVVASRIERRLAWERALEAADPETVRVLVPRGHRADTTLWRRIAATALRLEDDLDAAERDIDAAVEAVRAMSGDAARLAAFAAVAGAVRELLGTLGLRTPRDHRDALLRDGTLAFERIATVGTLELAAPQRRTLARMREAVAIVAAREEQRQRFDAVGAATAAWHTAPLPITDEQILTAETPRDVAECGLRFVAERAAADATLAVDQVAIALADPELGEPIALAGRDAGVDVHIAAGVPFAATAVGRTLALVAAYRTSRSPDDLAALLRRPAFERHIAERLRASEPDPDGTGDADLLAALDVVRQSRLPAALDQSLGEGSGEVVRRAIEAIDGWMAGLDRPNGVIEALAMLPWDDADRVTLERLRTIAGGIDGIAAALRGSATPLDLIVEECAALRLPAEPRERAIEAIGWLELLFEPAPHVVVLGMNEGCVPSGSGNDPLLPESVRERLGMATRAQRAARDAALLDALLARVPTTRFVVGRRSDEGEPLVPSRLLLRTNGIELARRVARIADHARALSGSRAWRRAVTGVSRFVVPEPPERARAIASMSVTGFRSYLACGMRFWLDRIEGTEEIDDDPREIPIPDLGTLVHAALKEFGADAELAATTDADLLRDELLRRFDRAARDAFGSRPLPAVRLQLDVMRQRLAPFAAWQAAHVAEGWRIVEVERKLPETFALTPDGVAPMRIRGQIDRIDYHAGRRVWRIIDYKTSDAGSAPRESHRSGKTGNGPWKDLQLPLYHAGMREELAITRPGSSIELGYVRLPSNPKRAGWCDAAFAADELDEAVTLAEKIVVRLRRGEFPLGEAMGWSDPYAGILQTYVFGGDDRPRDDDGAPIENGGEA